MSEKNTPIENILISAIVSLLFTGFFRVTGVASEAYSIIPFGCVVIGYTVAYVHNRLRAPDIVITVTQQPTPLTARFLEQDRLLEKRERLKRQLFDLNSEIETFAAHLTPDERHAWQNRPGPYGK